MKLYTILLCLCFAAPVQADPITLAQAEALAVQTHASVRSARLQSRGAAARVDEAVAGQRPQLSLSWSVEGANGDVIQPPPDHEGFFTITNSVNLALPTGARPGLQVDQARSGLAGAQAQVHAAERTLKNQVVTAFYDVLRDTALLEAASVTLDDARRQLDDAQKRQRAGDVPELDVLRAQVPVASARSTLVGAANTLQVARLTLSDLIGQEADPAPDVSVVAPAVSLPQAVEQAEVRSPDVVAAQANVKSSEAALASSRLYRTPSLSLSATDVHSTDQTAFSRLDSIQAQVVIPLSDGGTGAAQVVQAEAALEVAQSQLDLARRTARLNAATAWNTADTKVRQLAGTGTAEAVARISYDKTRRGYQEGLFPLSDVLAAHATWTQARLADIQARYDAAAALEAFNLLLEPLP